MCLVTLGGCAARSTYVYRQIVMGVETRIAIVAEREEEAIDAGQRAFARLAELEEVMSDYREQSELMRLCRTQNEDVRVSTDLFEVLERAATVHTMSGGTFDVSVGPLTLLWREARRSGAFPSAAAINEARQRSGGDAIVLDRARQTVRLTRPGMRLDLGGIGKGYAAAKAIETLREAGFPAAMVAIAGDIATGDPPPGETGWLIEIASPHGTIEKRRLRRTSISTSGDSEQFLEHNGVRYSHLLDPRTGLGATTQQQVTIIGPDGAMVDALSSALSIMDHTAREVLIRSVAPTYTAVISDRE